MRDTGCAISYRPSRIAFLPRISYLASRISYPVSRFSSPSGPPLHTPMCSRARPPVFVTGFLHPISGLDHVLAMVAVGLWGAQLGAPAIWVLPVAFPLVMAMGGMLGLMGVPVPGIEYGIAASAILLGAAVMLEMRAPLVVTAMLVGVFAIFHGHAHGTELPPNQSALLYSMGFVIATGCLHALGIGIGVVHQWTWGQKLLRAAGAVVAVGGVFFMWKALA